MGVFGAETQPAGLCAVAETDDETRGGGYGGDGEKADDEGLGEAVECASRWGEEGRGILGRGRRGWRGEGVGVRRVRHDFEGFRAFDFIVALSYSFLSEDERMDALKTN